MKGLKTCKTAEAIASLIVLNFRFKPLDCTENKMKRGKSPLELAGGKKLPKDWLGIW
jgi:hypothetical protein